MRKNRTAAAPLYTFASVISLLLLPNLQADTSPTSIGIHYTGADFEGRSGYQFQWTATPNATYLLQSTTNLAASNTWKTVDLVTPTNSQGVYGIKGRSIPENSVEYFRFILPQPRVFSVEPAVFASDSPVNAFVIGQCFESNDVVRVDGVAVSGVVYLSSSLLQCTLPPSSVGPHIVDLVHSNQVASSFTVMNQGQVNTGTLSLQSPPEMSPASPQGLWLSKKGYDYYKANSELSSRSMSSISVDDDFDGSDITTSGLLMPALMKAKEKANRASVWDSRSEVWMMIRSMSGSGGAPSESAGKMDLLDCYDEASIMPFSGEVCHQVVDLAVAGRGLDFIWARTYHSRIGRTGASVNGWTFSYDINIQPLGGDILVHNGTGRADTFHPGTNGVYACPGFFSEGVLSNNVFKLTFADSGYWQFNPLGGAPEAGKLAMIVDRNGNTIALHYDGQGRLAEVVDDLGRTNSIGYNTSGQLASISDFSGRTVSYQYYRGLQADKGGVGDLASVTSPPVIGTPNGNDFPTGKTVSYTYTKGFPVGQDSQNHLLLSCVDAAGVTTAQFTYDLSAASVSYLRCVSMQRWLNPPTMLSYLPQTPSPANQFATLRCIVNDPLGTVIECFYDARNRCVKSQEFTGRSTVGQPVTDIANRPAGKLRSSDPDFYETRAEWNNDCSLKTVIHPANDVSLCAYECDFNPDASPRNRGNLRVLREVAHSAVDLDGDGVADTNERVWRFDHDPRFGSDFTPAGIAYHAVKTKGTGANLGKSAAMGMGKGMYNWMKASFDNRIAGGPNVNDDSDSDSSLAIVKKHVTNFKWTAGRAPCGFVTGVNDPRGQVTETSYDAKGNRIKVRFPWLSESTTDFAYNSFGQCTSITNGADANGYRRVDTFTYYSSGPETGYPQTCTMDALGHELTHVVQHDTRGNLLRYVDPLGHDSLFTYNALDQCVRIQTPTNITARCATDYYYDANNNLVQCSTEMRDASDSLVCGKTSHFLHSPLHQVTRVESSVDCATFMTNDFVFDANDQCVLALSGDAVSGVDPHQAIACEYDELGRLFREICAPGSGASPTNEWSYTVNGSPATKKYVDSQDTLITTFTYDGFEAFGKAINTKPLTCTADCGALATALGKAINTKPLTGTANRAVPTLKTALGKAINTKPLTGTANRLVGPTPTDIGNLGKAIVKAIAVSSPGTALSTALGKAINTKPLTGTANRLVSPTATDVGNLGKAIVKAIAVSSPSSLGKAINTKPLTGTANLKKGDRLSLVGFGSFTVSRLAAVSDPMGNVTTFVHDANDNLRMVRQSGELNDKSGGQANIRLAESTFSYDAMDRLTVSRDAHFSNTGQPVGDGSCTTSFAYAPNGACTSVTDDLGRATTFAYDTVGRATGITSPEQRTSFAILLGSTGQAISCSETDHSDLGGSPQVFSWTNVFDSLGRCVRTTDNVGNTNRCAYDSLGRVEVIFNPREYSIRMTYDLQDRPTLIVQDLNGDGQYSPTLDISSACVWSSTCDRLQSVTDSHGNPTSYVYNSLGQCTQINRADGTHCSLVWSPRSNLMQVTDPNGSVTTCTYDLNDRCIASQITPGSGVASTTTSETFAYDGCSRLVTASNNVSVCTLAYDSLDNCVSETRDGFATTSTYDSLCNRLSVTYPGGRVLTYAYNSLDCCTNILETGLSLASFAYDGPDRLSRINYANGMQTRIFYDGISGTQNAVGDFGQGQVRRIQHSLGVGSPVSDVTLAWDRAQNKIGRRDVIFAPAIPRTNALLLTYDPADRLTHATLQTGTTIVRDTAYGLDRMGNRTNVTGAATCSGSYVMDASIPGPQDFQMNQYTATPCDSRSYDECGNLVSRSSAAGPVTYQFDAEGRLVLAQALNINTGTLFPVATYSYDGLGRRISKTVFGNGVPPVTTQYYYDGDCVIEERSGTSTTTYVRPPSCGSGACLTMRRNGQDYYYHTDDQDNIVVLTTTGGARVEWYDYDDYGAVTFLTSDGLATSATSSSVGNPYAFNGMHLDPETGLHNDDSGSYLETQTGRTLHSGSTSDKNPWSGGDMFLRKLVPQIYTAKQGSSGRTK